MSNHTVGYFTYHLSLCRIFRDFHFRWTFWIISGVLEIIYFFHHLTLITFIYRKNKFYPKSKTTSSSNSGQRKVISVCGLRGNVLNLRESQRQREWESVWAPTWSPGLVGWFDARYLSFSSSCSRSDRYHAAIELFSRSPPLFQSKSL